MDPATAAVLGTAITAGASVAVALITRPARKTVRQMDAVHHAVTVNSHSSDEPTVLDLIAELRDAHQATHSMISGHLADHARHDLSR